MRREKRTNIYLSLFVVTFSVILTACGARGEAAVAVDYAFRQEIIIPDIELEKEVQESLPEADTISDIALDDEVQEPTSNDEVQEPILNEDGSMEIYSARKIISLSDEIIVGQVALEDVLRGDPILYDRVIIDGFVFEWILSNYKDENNYFSQDGMLIISKEDDVANTQVIHVKEGEGGDAQVSLDGKFIYTDVNFDGIPDLLICSGCYGNQGYLTYYCFLQTNAGFVESPTFADICNPTVDGENKLILSRWRNNAASHSWATYKYQDNAFVFYRELREDAVGYDEDGNDILEWTVNGEVIGRSDELSESEIEDLIYNENSEWGIASDRW